MINASTIAILIKAHKQNDNVKFNSYAEFIYEYYIQEKELLSAKIIRDAIDGKEGIKIVSYKQPELSTAEIPIEKVSICSVFENYLIIATTDGIEYKCSSYEIIGKTMYLYGVETEADEMAKENEEWTIFIK